MTITGIHLAIAAGPVAEIGEVSRFSSAELVGYFGLNPRVRQPGDSRAQHGRISKQGRSLARGPLVGAALAAAKTPRGQQIAAITTGAKSPSSSGIFSRSVRIMPLAGRLCIKQTALDGD
jgi:transposase